MKKIWLLLIFVCLSACGFHLRGQIDIPNWLTNVAIIATDKDKQLSLLIKSQLERYNITVNDDPAQAKYWLIINGSEVHQQVVSIGASTNSRQYQLVMTVAFTIQSPKGDIVKPTKKIMVSRQLTVNNDRILGSNEEEELLVNEMRKDAVIQILNRLKS